MRKDLTRRDAGLTLIDAVALTGAAVVLAVLFLVVASGINMSKMDVAAGTELRGVGQAMMNWGQDNMGSYPLPSDLDKQDATVADQGRAKDTTSNIFSVLVFTQSVTPELFGQPRNAPWFEAKNDYQYARPKAAVDPEHALWDPSFSADFSNGKKANSGFAHLQPAGGRFDRWRSPGLRSGLTPMLSERGAEITGSATTGPKGALDPVYKDQSARMLTLEGGNAVWRGNVAFGDGHVEYVTTPSARPGASDFMFWDEPSDAASANDFLGIFNKAGETPAQYQAVWD